ncbi:Polysaccharide biosynthesis protein CapD [Bathymodiolus thermophilus thioautotrophic gill symbiont]|uniref:Polysaccharide biosynthesis protein CapD n=1 Tax=Bathymodiolus thermophilus thioautotrophic gill symbiont TaxID=2360 RepID=A0A3G3IMK2_9GAMM|nr:nucleoside-diphosphate sugar epimerase/dehydratase [Bathymodiolus thermophilus thioautotrophic gill symbiont]AYQ56969.1 Polysaccharide biosynthesis protein CapD [Bathymodiolus thermophilus thioautotrophic gill symbiont]
MIGTTANLSRFNKQLFMLLHDSVLLISILLASFSIRLGYWYFPESDLLWVIFGAPVIAVPIFIRFGLYRSVIRYMSFKDVRSIAQAVSLYALLWGIVGFMAAVEGIPRSVILINWVLSLVMVGGSRVAIRMLLSNNFKLSIFTDSNQKCVLIYGAGNAGVQLSSALEHTVEYKPVGFIDDSLELQNSQIRGLRIHAIGDIPKLIERFKVSEVLIAIPSISRTKRLAIINKLEAYSVVVRVLPGVAELAQGKVSIADLRKISVVDLLGRGVVKPNQDLLGKNIVNRVVMVTGAGGSIGSELCRQIIHLQPKALILFEMSELALYSIEKELARTAIDIYPILGSVNNGKRVTQVLKHFGVNTIYHAAAYKHVPMVEFNNTEGVNNNVLGTLNCAQAAINAGVDTFVLISTDKAVRPTNTMGATKRVAELILQALSTTQQATIFTMVRFGNVLGSSGSVIPLFTQQIKQHGPITVTDKNIIRYFMTIPESVELVIQAGAMGQGGDVFVLDMGKPVRIDELARKMIHLSGLEVKDDANPTGDIEIHYTGLRPGEKLFEELLIGDNVSDTLHPLIMRAEERLIEWNELHSILLALESAIDDNNQVALRELLIKLVPEFKPQCGITDLLFEQASLKQQK